MKKIISMILVMLMAAASLVSCIEINASVDKAPILAEGENENKAPIIIKGNDGVTPNIGENGNWWIAGVDTGVSVQGPKGPKGDRGDAGADGVPGNAGEDGKEAPLPTLRYNEGTDHYEVSLDGGKTWIEIENYDPEAAPKEEPKEETNVNVPMNNVTVTPSTQDATDTTEPKEEPETSDSKVETDENETVSNGAAVSPEMGDVIIINGADGIVPNIGENGNWWIGETDTGVSAKGEKGDKGSTGPAGENCYVSGPDGKDAVQYDLKFRVNRVNNKFELSCDGGATWQACGTVSNDPEAGKIFSFPMENLNILSGYINHEGSYVLPTSTTGDRHGAIIDITAFKEAGYTTIIIERNSAGTPMEYSFLASDLVIGAKLTFADGYTKTKSAVTQYVELEIPENAKYLYVGYNQLSVTTVPESVTFFK